MRLFIATELPQDLLDALAETQAALRGSVRGRSIRQGSFHVTLAFLGNVEAWRVADLANMLDSACAGHAAFETGLGELGHFGRANKATLWQGFTNKAAFTTLAQRIRTGLKQEGFSFDSKGFLPHVTLMRNADLSEGVLPMPYIAYDIIDTVALFESDLSGDMPVYTALHTVRLQAIEPQPAS